MDLFGESDVYVKCAAAPARRCRPRSTGSSQSAPIARSFPRLLAGQPALLMNVCGRRCPRTRDGAVETACHHRVRRACAHLHAAPARTGCMAAPPRPRRLSVREKVELKSQIKENSRDPKWGEHFRLLVYKPDEEARRAPYPTL